VLPIDLNGVGGRPPAGRLIWFLAAFWSFGWISVSIPTAAF